jgi:hypothetical protein
MESISMRSIEPLGFFTGSFLSILATEIVFEQDEFIYPQITQTRLRSIELRRAKLTQINF